MKCYYCDKKLRKTDDTDIDYEGMFEVIFHKLCQQMHEDAMQA